MKNLIEALKRFDSLETIIVTLEEYVFDENEEITIDDLANLLHDEADYSNE